MEGCGEDWCDAPWDPWTWWILLGLAIYGAGKRVIVVGGQVDVGGA